MDSMYELQSFRDNVLEAIKEDMPDCFKMDKMRDLVEEEVKRIGLVSEEDV
jgi:hypothetical protein